MNRIKWVLTGVAAGCFCLAMAHAEGEEAAQAAGKGRRARAARPAGAGFAAADVDGDKMVSLEEFKAFDAKRLEARKARQGDKFDPSKLPAAEERFKKIDADKNGQLTMEEFIGGGRQMDRQRQKQGNRQRQEKRQRKGAGKKAADPAPANAEVAE